MRRVPTLCDGGRYTIYLYPIVNSSSSTEQDITYCILNIVLMCIRLYVKEISNNHDLIVATMSESDSVVVKEEIKETDDDKDIVMTNSEMVLDDILGDDIIGESSGMESINL